MALSPVFAAMVVVVLSACASLPPDKGSELEVSQEVAADFKPVPFTASSGISPYSYQQTVGHGEWIGCTTTNTKGTMLVMHSDRAGYDKAKFCSGWIAQTFLSLGYDVVTVNRPGYGGSDDSPDFIGAASLDEIAAVAPAAVEAMRMPHPITAIWGYETGAAAAALAAKRLPGIHFVALGGGVYDYEETLRSTTDDYLRADFKAIKKSGGDKAFEERSVAYDLTGLPPSIIIYHGANDTAAPLAQAKSFSDSIASSGHYKVTYQVVLDQGHDLPWVYHRHLLEALLRQAAQQNP